MVYSGMLRRVALVITDVSEELSASIIWVTRIGELGTTSAVTSNRSTLRINSVSVAVNVISSPDEGCDTFLRNVSFYNSHMA
jgi:hypothetical protein